MLLSSLLLECLCYHKTCTPECWCCCQAGYWRVSVAIKPVHLSVGVAIKPVTGALMLVRVFICNIVSVYGIPERFHVLYFFCIILCFAANAD